MSEFKKLEIKRFPKIQPRETSEARFWKKFSITKERNYAAPPTSIHFCENGLVTDFVVAAGARLSVFDGHTCALKHEITKFNDYAYSACFRPDGRLISAGEGTGVIKVFDSVTRSPLRTFKEHTGAVRMTAWHKDKIHLFSGSDDSLVKFWDLATEASVLTLTGHTDYIRCGIFAPVGIDTWMTGSYDHSLKIWDIRQKNFAMTLDHGSPVEACLVLPRNSGLVMSAGGNQIKVWDLLAGGRLLQTFGNHQKTVTTIAIDATGTRLLSGSLDGHVKIYNLQTYQVLHGLKYKKPVLCVNISRNNSKLVAGLADGSLKIQKRDTTHNRLGHIFAPKPLPVLDDRKEEERNDDTTTETPNKRLREENIGEEVKGLSKYALQKTKKVKTKPVSRHSDFDAIVVDNHVNVETTRSIHLEPYDQALRKFKYHDALNKALATRQLPIIYTVLDELIQRGGLEIALLGRTEEGLEPILAFLTRYVTYPKYSSLLLDVCDIVLDMYSSIISESQLIQELFIKLNKQIKEELNVQQDMFDVQGALDSIVAASNTTYTLDHLN